jgi:hypothetical protein
MFLGSDFIVGDRCELIQNPVMTKKNPKPTKRRNPAAQKPVDSASGQRRRTDPSVASDADKLKHMRRLVKEGFDSIHRGDYEVITPDTLDAFMDSFRNKPRRQKKG